MGDDMLGHYNAAAWLLDRHIADGHGARVALRCHGESTTYNQLLAEVRRVQGALAMLGIAPGERVLMVLNDDPVFVAWFLGSLRSGVVPVPVSTMSTAADLALVAADCSARLLVIAGQYADRAEAIAAAAPNLAGIVVHRDADAVGAVPVPVPVPVPVAVPVPESVPESLPVPVPESVAVPVRPWSQVPAVHADTPIAPTTWDSPGFWLYSSGTTGLPKGVIHKHGDLQASYDTYATHILHVTEHDRFLSVAKLFFAYGLGNSLTFPLAAGATVILEPRRSTPAIMIDLVATEKPTLFFAAPGFVAALLDAGVEAQQFASVRASVTAGEALPADLQRRFSQRCGHPVLDGIGSTEATHIFLSNTLTTQAPGSSGPVVPGYAAKLLDDDGAEVTQPETPGYLHVKGPSVMSGYWNRPEATAAALIDGGWLRTGDVYTVDAAGNFTFLGRNNDMIKAGGIWVSPAEVEAALISHASVLEAAVVGSRNTDGLEETVAFVVARSGHSIDTDALDAHCRGLIAAFKRPRRIITVDVLPKTATGKIQRFALRESLVSQ